MSLIKKNEIFLLTEIVKKNFESKYKDSILGIFWTILSPLLLMILFTILFSTFFKKNIDNFPLYFFCGWCLFMFFNGSITASMNSLKGNKNILQRTSAPKYIFVLASIITEFINFLIMMILLVGIMIVTKAPFNWSTIPLSIIPVLSLLIMLIGIGLILSVACVYYTDIRHLWRVVGLMIMYSSCIFFPISIIPKPYRDYLVLNPFYWVINQFRCLVYYGIIPEVGYIVNLVLLSLIILVLGIIIFKKYEKRITIKF